MDSYRGVGGPGSTSPIADRVWRVQKKRRTGEEFPDDGKKRGRSSRKDEDSSLETHVDIRGKGKDKEEGLDTRKKNKRNSRGPSQGVSQKIDLLI